MPEQGGSREGNREWGVGSRGGRGGPDSHPTPHSPLPTPSPVPTPGEVAYVAYCAAWGNPDWIPAWQSLLPESHRAWEAAAQAVLALQEAKAPAVTLATLHMLADEATPYLVTAFGAALRGVERRVSDDGCGAVLLSVIAQVAPHALTYLEGVLRSFDDTWLCANSHRTGAQLLFDYEIVLEDTPHV